MYGLMKIAVQQACRSANLTFQTSHYKRYIRWPNVHIAYIVIIGQSVNNEVGVFMKALHSIH